MICISLLNNKSTMSASNMTFPTTAKWTSLNLAQSKSVTTKPHFLNTFKSFNRSPITAVRHTNPSTNVRPLAATSTPPPSNHSSRQHHHQQPSSTIRLPPTTYLPHTRATIIGAGMAGLLSAQVASKYFDEVILIERDAGIDRTIENESLLEVGITS